MFMLFAIVEPTDESSKKTSISKERGKRMESSLFWNEIECIRASRGDLNNSLYILRYHAYIFSDLYNKIYYTEISRLIDTKYWIKFL